MSFSTVKSAAMEGLAVEMVYVEADVSNGSFAGNYEEKRSVI